MFSNYYFNIIQNRANLNYEIKNSIKDLKINFILITIYSEESKDN